MQLELAQILLQTARDNSEYGEIQEEYSGRGMFGRTTVAFKSSMALSRLLYLSSHAISEAIEEGILDEDISEIHSDKLGFSKIYY